MKKINLFLLGFLFIQATIAQTVDWSYNIGSEIKPQSPAIASDGTIYIGSDDNTNFHAINADGTLKWRYTDITDNVYSSASIGSDGTIYVGAKDKFLHAINPSDGTQKWKFNMVDFSIYTTPAIANDGTIYIGSDKSTASNFGKFYAINPDGTQKWLFTTAGYSIRSTAAIASNGTVYIASDDDYLYALNPVDGSEIWKYNLGGDVEGHIALDTDGTIFVGVDEGTATGSVIAINPNGTLKWKSVNTGRVFSSPVLNNGFMYFGTKDTKKLYALDASTGIESWSFAAGDIINSSPAIGDDGKIYFGSFDDKLYCLNADGTENFNVELSAFNLWSSPAIKNGKLYIGSYDGKLYAVNIPSTNLASSNWSMFAKNLQHTSSDEKTNSWWTGETNSDWATSGNWNKGVPTGSTHAIIQEITNAPIIGASTNASVNNLTITEADGLVINSGGTLIVNGTSSGNVTYKRTLGTTNWYLMSSPVSGVTFNDAFVTANNIDDTTSTLGNRGVATYTSSNNTWSYLQAAETINTTAGTGYSIKQDVSGDISFTGTINTADVSFSALTGYNLLGNPFTSYLNGVSFINGNSANIDGSQIWVWNQTNGNYDVKNLTETFDLAPAQGFFVNTTGSATVNMLESYQQSTGSAFQKSAKTEVHLSMTDGTNNRYAKVFYSDNATKGYDNGYDGETFGGIPNELDVFTHLVADSQNKKFQIQSLPNSDFETMEIPVGIRAAAGKEITFTAEAMNLPEGLKVYLEDRTANITKRLDEANSSYKVTLDEATNGIGRFYLHTKASSVLNTNAVALENVSVYSTSKNSLRVVGLKEGKATLKLYNILGKQVFASKFNSNGVQDLSLPTLSTGIYVVQLETENGKLNKKITLE